MKLDERSCGFNAGLRENGNAYGIFALISVYVYALNACCYGFCAPYTLHYDHILNIVIDC